MQHLVGSTSAVDGFPLDAKNCDISNYKTSSYNAVHKDITDHSGMGYSYSPAAIHYHYKEGHPYSWNFSPQLAFTTG